LFLRHTEEKYTQAVQCTLIGLALFLRFKILGLIFAVALFAVGDAKSVDASWVFLMLVPFVRRLHAYGEIASIVLFVCFYATQIKLI
ncbi:hypothetical protein OV760_26980, partial [Salmonella enterica subsp. enterica serovar 1,4,[5],12:i:-]|nr:hypothetical protein [Salmonella enterica subsp. enterica serovar 1,4,[5],12:i:-]